MSDAVSVDDVFVGRGHSILMAHASPSLDARGPDSESRGWVAALSAIGSSRDEAVQRLHALLVRAARFEVTRQRRAFGTGGPAGHLDDLAVQAADDALMAIIDKLHTYRGDSRFTTWAYKFALLEAGAKMRRRAWQEREIPLEADGWAKLADHRASPSSDLETAELIARHRRRDRLCPDPASARRAHGDNPQRRADRRARRPAVDDTRRALQDPARRAQEAEGPAGRGGSHPGFARPRRMT